MKEYKGVIFDLCGTLGYFTLRPDSFARFSAYFGLSHDEKKELRDISLRKSYAYVKDYFCARYGYDLIDFSLLEKEIKPEVDSFKLFDETISVLETLNNRGIKLSLISNIGELYLPVFYNSGLDKYCEHPYFSCF
mgnify:CR=1 FL=1